MNYGKFFRLNNDKSDIGNGIVVFDYLWLRDAAHKESSPEYPIYLTITKESIDFRVHYLDDQKSADKNEKTIVKHLHNIILSLPLSDNIDVKDGLTDTLVEGYETNFPTWEKGESNYLFELLAKTIINNDTEKDNGYSTLKEFNINIEELEEIFEAIEKIKVEKDKVEKDKAFNECIKMLMDNNEDSKYMDIIKKIKKYKRDIHFIFSRFIRKLILDFIFDLEQTHVFQISPYYENISIKLKENYFFSALVNKAEYYYYRKMSEGKKEEKQISKLFFLREYLFPAEEQWVNSIINPKSSNYFVKKRGKHGWFENPEKELKKVEKKNASWFYSNLSYCKFKNEQNDKNTRKHFIRKKDELKDDIKALAKKSSHWQMLKFDFSGGLYTIWACAICCVFSFIVMKMIQSGCENLECSLCPVFIGTIICATGIISDVRKREKRYSFGLHLFFPRLLAAIITVWITLSFSEDIINTFYNGKYNQYILCIVILLLTAFLLIFIMNEIRKTSPYLKIYKRFWRAIQLSAVAFLYSYVIGILVTAFVSIKFLGQEDKEYAIKICGLDVDVYIFPNYLLLFTFVAMFIGIFINLIFEDKQITDSI